MTKSLRSLNSLPDASGQYWLAPVRAQLASDVRVDFAFDSIKRELVFKDLRSSHLPPHGRTPSRSDCQRLAPLPRPLIHSFVMTAAIHETQPVDVGLLGSLLTDDTYWPAETQSLSEKGLSD